MRFIIDLSRQERVFYVKIVARLSPSHLTRWPFQHLPQIMATTSPTNSSLNDISCPMLQRATRTETNWSQTIHHIPSCLRCQWSLIFDSCATHGNNATLFQWAVKVSHQRRSEWKLFSLTWWWPFLAPKT